MRCTVRLCPLCYMRDVGLWILMDATQGTPIVSPFSLLDKNIICNTQELRPHKIMGKWSWNASCNIPKCSFTIHLVALKMLGQSEFV